MHPSVSSFSQQGTLVGEPDNFISFLDANDLRNFNIETNSFTMFLANPIYRRKTYG